MERYLDRSRDSGVTSYSIEDDSITVGFKGGAEYLYNYAKTGRDHVEEMKRLAKAGQGLNTYIQKNVRKRYAAKLK